MKKWACLKDSVVLNIIVADNAYVETNNDVNKLYDEFVEYDSIPVPDIRIGSYFSDGVWKNPLRDLRGVDYRNQDLSSISFRDTNLDGCDFSGSNISGCDFRGSTGTFNLVGASWNGDQINHGPIVIPNPFYYFMLTDVFTVMGCVTMRTSLVPNIPDIDVPTYDTDHPGKPTAFWASVRDLFDEVTASWQE